MPPVPLDGPQLTLALVEAQVGSLVDVLPVALLVTTAQGQILRANAAAVELFGSSQPLVGQAVTVALDEAERKGPLRLRLRLLRHEDEVLRLYVIHEAEG